MLYARAIYLWSNSLSAHCRYRIGFIEELQERREKKQMSKRCDVNLSCSLTWTWKLRVQGKKQKCIGAFVLRHVAKFSNSIVLIVPTKNLPTEISSTHPNSFIQLTEIGVSWKLDIYLGTIVMSLSYFALSYKP